MVEKITGSEADIAYAMKAFKDSGAAYSGPAPDALVENPALRQLMLSAEREAIRSKLKGEASKLSGDSLKKFEEALSALDGVDSIGDIQAIGKTLEKMIAELAAADSNEKSHSAAESLDEKKARLWAEIRELNEKTLKGMDALHDAGLMGDDERDKWKDELTEINNMPDGPEKARLLKEFYSKYSNRIEEIKEGLSPDDPRRKLLEEQIVINTQISEKQADLSRASEAETGPTSPDRQGDLVDQGNSRSAFSIEVASISPSKTPDIASVGVGAVESISRVDSGQLSPTNIKIVSSSTKASGTQL